MVNLLAKGIVEVTTGSNGETVVIDPMMPMLMSGVYLFLVLLPILAIIFFFIYTKKLQNQQIMAAIEKGMPVQDLLVVPVRKERGWIPNISAGIGLLFVAIAMAIVGFFAGIYGDDADPGSLIIFMAILLVIGGIGLTRLLRGIFQKAANGNLSPEKIGQPSSTPPAQ